jgi:hypothetical protein
MDEKRLRKKVALIMTDYEEGRLQPTPAGHAQLAAPRANYFLLVSLGFHVPAPPRLTPHPSPDKILKKIFRKIKNIERKNNST